MQAWKEQQYMNCCRLNKVVLLKSMPISIYVVMLKAKFRINVTL